MAALTLMIFRPSQLCDLEDSSIQSIIEATLPPVDHMCTDMCGWFTPDGLDSVRPSL